jgi:hypothetical protein
MLDWNHLRLPLTTMAVQELDQDSVRAGELVAVLETHFAAGEALLGQGSPTEALKLLDQLICGFGAARK